MALSLLRVACLLMNIFFVPPFLLCHFYLPHDFLLHFATSWTTNQRVSLYRVRFPPGESESTVDNLNEGDDVEVSKVFS